MGARYYLFMCEQISLLTNMEEDYRYYQAITVMTKIKQCLAHKSACPRDIFINSNKLAQKIQTNFNFEEVPQGRGLELDQTLRVGRN